MEQLRNSLNVENTMITSTGKNRFDLEQEILECWNITKDLDTLLSMFNRDYTEDELLNIIIGMKTLYNRKFELLFDTFEECLKKKEFREYD